MIYNLWATVLKINISNLIYCWDVDKRQIKKEDIMKGSLECFEISYNRQ